MAVTLTYTFDISTQLIEIIDQTEEYVFKDMDIYKDGTIALLLQDQKY